LIGLMIIPGTAKGGKLDRGKQGFPARNFAKKVKMKTPGLGAPRHEIPGRYISVRGEGGKRLIGPPSEGQGQDARSPEIGPFLCEKKLSRRAGPVVPESRTFGGENRGVFKGGQIFRRDFPFEW